MTELSVLCLLQNEDTASAINSAIDRVEHVSGEVVMLGGEHGLTSVDADNLPDVLVYEFDGIETSTAEEFVRWVEPYRNKLSVYIVYGDGDVDLLRKMMRAGVKDAISVPVNTQEFIQDITSALSEKRARESAGGKGKIVGLLNAKGGSGATTVGINLAYQLVAEFNATVAFVDIDIQFGAAAHLLDLHSRNNIMEALVSPERIDMTFLSALMTKHDSGLDVLASPSDLSPLGGVSPHAVIKMINTLAENYEFVVVDIPRVLTGWSMAVIRLCEPLVLVTQNTISTIRDAKLLVDKLKHEGVSLSNIEVLNNRAMAKMASVSIEQMKQALGKEKIHRVRNDYKTTLHAQDQGRPAVEVAKGSVFTKDIHALAEYLAVMKRGEVKKGLFSGLFSHK